MKDGPLVIITKPVGRLANRLLLHAHFIGAAAEHGFRVVNPAMGDYAHYFPSCRDLLCRFPETSRFPSFGRVGRKLLEYAARAGVRLPLPGRRIGRIRLSREEGMDLDSPAFLDPLRRHSVLMVEDWFFRSPVDTEKHAGVIRRFFTPWPVHLRNVQAVIEPARERRRFLIGVHVRRGDYATFKGGRFLYTPQQYRAVMEGACSAFACENVTFLICSDEAVPMDVFAGLDVIRGNGHPLEDLYALAACDRLMGPPSTYTKWASFYGDVPLYEIADPASVVERGDFAVNACLGHTPAATFPPHIRLR
jgi:hypothetical protein